MEHAKRYMAEAHVTGNGIYAKSSVMFTREHIPFIRSPHHLIRVIGNRVADNMRAGEQSKRSYRK
jgi:hypothetical protein